MAELGGPRLRLTRRTLGLDLPCAVLAVDARTGVACASCGRDVAGNWVALYLRLAVIALLAPAPLVALIRLMRDPRQRSQRRDHGD